MTAPAPSKLSLFNTLTRRVEPLAPLAPPRVTLYTCGPTVWNYAHIGNFRTFLFEDLLRRWLERSGYDVFHIMNLTDVDDRTIKAARQAGKQLTDHTAPFTKAFFEDRDYLRIKPAHVYTPATEYMPQMIALVSKLIERGVAYKGEDGSVYFAINKFPTYGRLSQLDKLRKCCGVQTLDIHAGGIDLIFPHHENEIAQSEGATGQQFSRHWVHGEFLNVRGTKMSKRHGNFLTARDLREQGVDAAAVRLLFFQTHYRQPVDFTDDALDAAKEGVRRLGEFHARLVESGKRETGDGPLGELSGQLEQDVATALNDDLNAPRAVAALFEFVRAANRELDRPQRTGGAAAALEAFQRVAGKELLDVLPTPRAVDPATAGWIDERIAARAQARKSKDFKAADAIRAELAARGIDIEDTPLGTKWKTR